MEAVNFKNSLSNLHNRIVQSEKALLLLLVVVSLLVRIILMLYFHSFQFPDERRMGYEMGWIAQNIVNGEGFKVGNYHAWMAPLYPFILSLAFRIFGSYTSSSSIAILIMQSFISSMVVIPIYFIGKRLSSKGVGVITALMWIFHPASVYYAIKFVWSSSLTSLVLAWIVLIFLRLAEKSTRNLDPLLGGLFIGIGALNDPVIMTIIPVLGAWLLWRSQNTLERSMRQLTVIGFTVIALIAPWTLRNYHIFNQFVPIKSTFGVNLWQGNYNQEINQWTAGLDFEYKLRDFYSEEELSYLLELNEVERDKALQNRALEFIRSNPKTFAKYTLQRIYMFWRITISKSGTLIDKVLFALIPFTLFGVINSWRRWRDALLLLLIFVTYPVVYYVTHADFNRFRFPIEEIMLVFDAIAICGIIGLAKHKRLLQVTKRAEIAVKRKLKW